MSGSGSLAARAFARIERDGLITNTLSGIFLRRELDRILWKNADHLDVRQLQDYFAQYLYLPRLTYSELVLDAIRDGVASLTWDRDTFAYATEWDADKKRYLGLQASKSGIAVIADGRSVIVKPKVARTQLDSEALAQNGDSGAPAAVGEKRAVGGRADGGPIGEPIPAAPSKPTRFHGTISVNPLDLPGSAKELSQEILQHLASKMGVKVEVVIDINAQIPDGADESLVRTITENCRALKFDRASGFEP